MTIPAEMVYFCGGIVFGVAGLFGLVWLLASYQRRRRNGP